MDRLFAGAVALAIAVVAGLAWQWLAGPAPIVRGPGVVAAQVPAQSPLGGAAPVFEKDGFRIVGLAAFAMEARVVRKQNYCCSAPDRLAPTDVVFGWGRMSDEAVLARIGIRQSDRFYYWRYHGTPPIPDREIERSSANMHLIPATRAIAKQVERLREGSVVTLRGYLVELTGTGGFVWRSSLTREDTGSGACELVWVEELEAS